MAFESGVIPEDCRYAVIVPLYKGKRERTEYRNHSYWLVKHLWKNICRNISRQSQ